MSSRQTAGPHQDTRRLPFRTAATVRFLCKIDPLRLLSRSTARTVQSTTSAIQNPCGYRPESLLVLFGPPLGTIYTTCGYLQDSLRYHPDSMRVLTKPDVGTVQTHRRYFPDLLWEPSRITATTLPTRPGYSPETVLVPCRPTAGTLRTHSGYSLHPLPVQKRPTAVTLQTLCVPSRSSMATLHRPDLLSALSRPDVGTFQSQCTYSPDPLQILSKTAEGTVHTPAPTFQTHCGYRLEPCDQRLDTLRILCSGILQALSSTTVGTFQNHFRFSPYYLRVLPRPAVGIIRIHCGQLPEPLCKKARILIILFRFCFFVSVNQQIMMMINSNQKIKQIKKKQEKYDRRQTGRHMENE